MRFTNSPITTGPEMLVLLKKPLRLLWYAIILLQLTFALFLVAMDPVWLHIYQRLMSN